MRIIAIMLILLLSAVSCTNVANEVSIQYDNRKIANIWKEDSSKDQIDSEIFAKLQKKNNASISYGDSISLVFSTEIESATIYDRVLNEDGSPLYMAISNQVVELSESKSVDYIVSEHPAIALSSQFPNPYIETPRGIEIEYAIHDTIISLYFVFSPHY